MRVVLDTNVVLSAFLWQKKLKPIYDSIRSRKITPCFSQLTWDELLRTSFIVSGDKHLLSLKGFQGIEILPPKEFLKILEL